MKYLWLFGMSALLIFSPIPIQAQQVAPTPSANTVIDHVADLAQTLGAVGFVTVALAVALVLLILGVLVFLWKVVLPFLAAVSSANTAREAAVEAERKVREDAQSSSSTQLKLSNERERETQALRTRQAEAMELSSKHLEFLGVIMTQNDERQQKRQEATEQVINLHTDEQIQLLREDVSKLQTTANESVEIARQAVTPEQLLDALEPIRRQLDNILQNAGDMLRTVTRTGGTGPLNPASVPLTDPALSSNGESPVHSESS